MKFELATPLKDQTGKTHAYLIVKPHIKVKEVKLANEAGKKDIFESTCHLMASMVGLAYEDIMEMDIVDHDKLDTVIAEIRYPELKAEREAAEAKAKGAEDPKESTSASSSTKPSKT